MEKFHRGFSTHAVIPPEISFPNLRSVAKSYHDNGYPIQKWNEFVSRTSVEQKRHTKIPIDGKQKKI